MPTESFLVTPLPVSVAPDAPHHVSLFVAPRLSPDGRLGEFDRFVDWARALVDTGTFALFDQHGSQIAVTPKLDTVDVDLWPQVFDAGTPVRAFGITPLHDRTWKSFNARHVHDVAVSLHVDAVVAGPIDPPAPDGTAASKLLLGLIEQDGRFEAVGRPKPLGERRGTRLRNLYDESAATAALDGLIDEVEKQHGGLAPATVVAALDDRRGSSFGAAVLELHRARRFYERPEARRPHQARPDEGRSLPRLPEPDPDFHERCAHLGDTPAMLRKLGLVVDLRVDDLARLAAATELRAELAVDGLAGTSTRVACTRHGDALATVPRGEDWKLGRLRLGDPERFAVLGLDPDGAALKADRYLWTLPRLMQLKANGDPVDAAAPAQRTTGFNVVRTGRAEAVKLQAARAAELDSAVDGASLLHTEDLTRGMRVEVWDDHVGRWFSLHRRLADISVDGNTVLDDHEEDGFLQGANVTETPDVADSPVYSHETVFGWEGWSLSAPTEARGTRFDEGDETFDDPPDQEAVTPVQTSFEVAPGTLPRLRYGRRYAFRAWAVDLAGNSVDHDLGSRLRNVAPAVVEAAAAAIRGRASEVRSGVASALEADLRRELDQLLPEPASFATDRPPRPAEPDGRAVALSGDPAIDPALVAAVGRFHRGRGGRTGAPTRADRVNAAFRAAAGGPGALAADVARFDPETLASIAAAEGVTEPVAELLHDLLVDLSDTVTPVVPFLRWDPVTEPVVVPRHRYSAGESVRHLVIRSGVDQELEGGELTLHDPESYATASQAAHPSLVLDHRATSERHLVPPKTSQSEAELHGAFDQAIASPDPEVRRRFLAMGVRGDGTLLDVDVASIDPPGGRIPQHGVALETGPEIDPSVPLVTDPALLPKGEPLHPGQYVVHTEETLHVPYLPDPLATGVSLRFVDAGRDRGLRWPDDIEGLTVGYRGDWPELQPKRLVLSGGPELRGHVVGDEIRISVPPGETLRLRVSSALDRESLELLGPWMVLPERVRDDPAVAEAAADGWLWSLTPSDEIQLVHAVPRPVEAPRPTVLEPIARPGSTHVRFWGALDCHGPSTEQVDAEACWSEWVDDVSLPAPEVRRQRGVAFTTRLQRHEDLVVLAPIDEPESEDAPPPVLSLGGNDVLLHPARHELGDTRHRTIHYRFRGTTRFREYFHPRLLDPSDPDKDFLGAGCADDRPVLRRDSVVGPARVIDVPSRARPAPPVVHSVLPLFVWETATEPAQPMGVRRRRRAGLRIYLERPWYDSGDGELLGIVIGPNEGLAGKVSEWGADPVWRQRGPEQRSMRFELADFLTQSGFDDRWEPGRPVGAARTLPLVDEPRRPRVQVLGYQPEFNAERGLWFVDVSLAPGSAFWPFIRLAVARYQPSSLDGLHLSEVVRCDFTQPAPERSATVTRPDERQVRVIVRGPVGFRHGRVRDTSSAGVDALAAMVRSHRYVVARLERRDPAVRTDLGWTEKAFTELMVEGFDDDEGDVVWLGTIDLPSAVPARRPGEHPDWRIAIEEWELLETDPESREDAGGELPMEARIVYADHIPL